MKPYTPRSKRHKRPSGDPFGSIGNLSPGTRIKRGRDGKVHEDDPGFNPKKMGNRRYRARGFVRQG